MAIKKIAISEDIIHNVVPLEKIASSPEVVSRFEKVLASLKQAKDKTGKKISPKVDDFLYASCIMMHAAEAALIDQETGMPLLNKEGKPVTGKFVKITDHKGRKSVKWESSDGIMPYKNGNGDIFPEEDLLKAYKDWVGKPLCRDHVSNTVDGIRGIIIDTYYDKKHKRVHALFALDRKNYADLARKVEAGYATSVSMGTAVGMSVCAECGNVATTEAEYCSHVKNRTAYGEVNLELSPIELSIVVTGADPAAKIKTVLAHLHEYEQQVEKIVGTDDVLDNAKLAEVQNVIGDIKHELDTFKVAKDVSDVNEKAIALLKLLGNTDNGDSLFDEARNLTREFIANNQDSFASLSDSNLDKLIGTLNHLELNEEKSMLLPHLFERTKGVLSGGDVQVAREDSTLPLTDTDGDTLKSDQDLMEEMSFHGGTGDLSFNAPQNFASFYDDKFKTTNDATNLYKIEHKLKTLAEQIESLRKEFKEKPMTFADLKKRALERKSYFQGTEDPSNLPYDRMGDDHKIRESEDKQMVGDELDTAADNPDENEKKLLQRAELEARQARRASILQKLVNASELKDSSGNTVAVKNDATGEVKAVEQDAKDGKKDEDKKDEKEDKDDDKKDDKDKDEDKKDKKDDDKDDKDKKDDKDDKKDDKDDDKEDKKASLNRKAYFQGTEDPSVLPYPLMGDQDGLRENADKHMHQTGDMGGEDGMVPGDEQLRSGLQRIANKKLSATFYKSANPSESRWDFFAGKGSDKEKVLSCTASQVYGDMLDRVVAEDKTLGDFFHSKQYGAKVLKLIRTAGPEGAAEEMGVEPVMPAAPEAPEMPSMDDEMAGGNELSDLKDAISTAIEKLDVGLEELKSAVSDDEGVEDLEVMMEGPESGMPPSPELPEEMPMPGAVASVSDKDMLEAYAFLTDIVTELSYLDTQLTSKASLEFKAVANSALTDASVATKRVAELVDAYKVNKRLNKLASEMKADCGDGMMAEDMASDKSPEMMANDYNREKEDMFVLDEEDMKVVEEEAEEAAEEEIEKHEKEMHLEDFMYDKSMDVSANLEARLAKRRAYRESLIAQAGKYDDVYEGEHGGQGPTLGLEGDDKVENLHETHEAMMDVATKDPAGPKVSEAAKKLDEAIKRGGINSSKLNELVALGAVDAEVVSYWKNYYGQADGGSEFADGLVKEFNKSASQQDGDAKIVRYKRAYMLGMEAQDKGLINRTASALNEFVDSMVEMPDAIFNSYKNIVAQTKGPAKGVIPQVRGDTDGIVRSAGLTTEGTVEKDSTAPTIDNLSAIFLGK